MICGFLRFSRRGPRRDSLGLSFGDIMQSVRLPKKRKGRVDIHARPYIFKI